MVNATKVMDERPVVHQCSVYTRVSGYYRATKGFNVGKQAEHQQRNLIGAQRVNA